MSVSYHAMHNPHNYYFPFPVYHATSKTHHILYISLHLSIIHFFPNNLLHLCFMFWINCTLFLNKYLLFSFFITFISISYKIIIKALTYCYLHNIYSFQQNQRCQNSGVKVKINGHVYHRNNGFVEIPILQLERHIHLHILIHLHPPLLFLFGHNMRKMIFQLLFPTTIHRMKT